MEPPPYTAALADKDHRQATNEISRTTYFHARIEAPSNDDKRSMRTPAHHPHDKHHGDGERNTLDDPERYAASKASSTHQQTGDHKTLPIAQIKTSALMAPIIATSP
ncbi:hypothetical protein ACW9FF_09585 [Ralstonia mannitolilytica]|uniref:hypothetical protein n=2 Tax=Ralstonia mannitolilytica TaxID=105219 RepID=UPI00292D4D0E|nr:hypothetical protein [Ralstonia mannitolilytica]